MISRITRRQREEVARAKGRVKTMLLVFRFSLIVFCLTPLVAPAQAAQRKARAVPKAAVYVCVMDSDVKSAKPGKCPKCGMVLRKASDGASATPADRSKPEVGSSRDSSTPFQIPDTTVYDQDGKRLHFYSDLVKGKTVAINFIFTTCTTICPPLTATFRKLQQELGERVGRDVQLISISVDPTTDVPERLKAYSAKFNAGPGWAFVTGEKQELDMLLKSLGASVGDKNDHTPMVLVGNESTGYWTRTYGLAPVSTLVKTITDAAATRAATSVTKSATTAAAQTPMRAANRITTAGDGRDDKGVAVEKSAREAAQPAADPGKAKTPAGTAAPYFPNTVLLTQDNEPVHFFDDLL